MGSPPIEWGLYTDFIRALMVAKNLSTRAIVATQTNVYYDWNEFVEVKSFGEC